MKPLFQSVLATLVMACIITSCSKKNDKVNQDPNVKTEELQDYYILNIYNNKGELRLGVIYFVKEANGISAVFDANGLRRQLPATVSGNRFSFDVNSNGVSVFSFKLKREANGGVALDTFSYKRTDDAQSKLDFAEIIKVSDAPSLDGSKFTYTIPLSASPTHLYFEAGNKWKYQDINGTTAQYSYYVIGNGIGWKCEDAASGGTSMGVMVPVWTGNGATMLLQTSINRLDAAHIQSAVKN